MIRLSVIIPAYNAESYLRKCVQSLQSQDIPSDDYELVIVNDGSTDQTLEVITGLTREFGNIICINQENTGVSLARNAGIEKARGKYLLFIDADDYAAPNVLQRVLNIADQNVLDVLWLGYRVLKADNTLQCDYLFPGQQNKIFTGTDAYAIAVSREVPDPDRSCGILYLRELITRFRLRYIPQVPILEDGEFIARVLCLAGKCGFDNVPAYIRTTRAGSAINSNVFFSEGAVNGFIKAAANLKRFQSQDFLSEAQKRFLNQPICKYAMLFANSSFGKDGVRGLGKMKRALQSSEVLICDLDGCSKEYKREGEIFNFSPVLYAYYKKIKVKVNHVLVRMF